MNGFHPKEIRAAICVVTAVLLAGGCKSTSSGVNNPFLAPDRVAPPSTRMIAPGQAQPYYQGDPLPVMQSATAPPNANLAEAATPASAMSSTGKTLGWNSPNGSSSVATNEPAAAPTVATTTPPPFGVKPASATTIMNEAPVAVPTDADSLRFALPAPTNPEPATTIVAANAVATQPSAAPQNQGVVQASYTAPSAATANPVPPAANTAVPSLAPQSNSPWRSPQVPPSSSAPTIGVQPQPSLIAVSQQMIPAAYPQAPVVVEANPVAVQLRAVPSPPPQPGDPMPRIRIPGYEVPQTATADGFRPRSAMR